MEDKTDGVAEVAEKARRLVTDRLLPDRPHHLVLHQQHKYPSPEGFWFKGRSSRLQYMTNLSDVDRGILLTVPYFNIMEDPDDETPIATPKPASQKADVVRKKISMKDYKSRRKSTSPTDEDLAKTASDAKQGAAPANEFTSTPKQDGKNRDEDRKLTNGYAVTRAEKVSEKMSDKARLEPNGDSVSGPRVDRTDQSGQDAAEPLPKSDENYPLLKKVKRSDDTSAGDRVADAQSNAQSSRDASRDKLLEKGMRERNARDRAVQIPAGTTNGRRQVGSEKDKDLSPPRSTIMVNGPPSGGGSSTSTPRKGDRSDIQKSNNPPVLSPIYQVDNNDNSLSPRKKSAGKTPLKGPKVAGGHSRTNSATRPPIPDLLSPIRIGLDDDNDSPARKSQEKVRQKGPIASKPHSKHSNPKSLIPRLLSPTLPAIIEEDLARNPVKAIAVETDTIPKKSRTEAAMESKPPERKALPEPKSRPEQPKVCSKVVVLKYKKALKARVQAILSLPSKSRREALRRERSASIERTPPARKRPLPGPAAVPEAPPLKRSRPSTDALASTKPTAPSTPLKSTTGTSMIRVLSNTSQADTPGDTTTLTPGAATERPPTSSATESSNPGSTLDPASAARSALYRERHAKLSKLGSRLKHAKDAIMKRSQQLSDSELKRAAALHFEMVLAYMVAFKAHNAQRQLERKPLDLVMWESLLPHFGELRARLKKGSAALLALTVAVHALCLEEYCNAFTTLDVRTAGDIYSKWAVHARKRRQIWEEARTLMDKVEEGKMRAGFGPWTSVNDTVSASLLIMRRWASAEGVDWKAELEVPGLKD